MIDQNTPIGNISPTKYAHLITKKGQSVLTKNNLKVDIEVEGDCPVLFFRFAGMASQVPEVHERSAEDYHNRAYTIIKADDIGATDDDTVKNVLSRLGRSLEDTHYWKVYAYELETPNERGLTRFLTTNISDAPVGEAKFAGFGYKSIRDANKNPEYFAAWQKENDERLMNCLYPVVLLLNDKLMTVKVRDMDSNLYINEYRCGSDIGTVDSLLIWHAEKWATQYRSNPNNQIKNDKHKAGAHILPNGHENLLSDEALSILSSEGLRVEITTLPSAGDLHRYACDKFFFTEQHQPKDMVVDSERYGVITSSDMGVSVEDTANTLMASMGGNKATMSYWAVYQYESDVANEYGHTIIYTTDEAESKLNQGELASIAVSYNLGHKPVRGEEKDWQVKQRQAAEKTRANWTPAQEEAEILQWQAYQLQSLKNSIFHTECFANNNLLEVSLYRMDNGDYQYIYDDQPYQKDPELFNTQLVKALTNRKDLLKNKAVNNQKHLREINAA